MKILWRAISPEYMTLHSSFPGKHKARTTSSMKSPPPCPSRETDFLVTRLFSIKGCALPSGPIRPVVHFRDGSTALRASHHFRNAANAAATLSAHSRVSASSKSKETPLTESIHASRRGCTSSSARRRIHPGRRNGYQRFRAAVRNDRNEHVSRLGGGPEASTKNHHLRIGQIRRDLGKKLVIQVKRHRFSPLRQQVAICGARICPTPSSWRKGFRVSYDIHAHRETPRFATMLRTADIFSGRNGAFACGTHASPTPEEAKGPNGPFASEQIADRTRFPSPTPGIRIFPGREQNALASNTWRRRGIFPTAWVEQERHGS